MPGPGGGGIVSECQAGPFFGGKRGNMLILVHHISTYLSMFQLFILWNGMLKNCHHFNPFDGDLFYFYGGILLLFFRHLCKVQVWSWFGNGSKPLIFPVENNIEDPVSCWGWARWTDRQKSLELVGGLEHVLFFHILGLIIPTNFHIFQRGRYTTNQGRFEVDFWRIHRRSGSIRYEAMSFPSSSVEHRPEWTVQKRKKNTLFCCQI